MLFEGKPNIKPKEKDKRFLSFIFIFICYIEKSLYIYIYIIFIMKSHSCLLVKTAKSFFDIFLCKGF